MDIGSNAVELRMASNSEPSASCISSNSCLSQIKNFLLLYLKLKAWRFIFIVIPISMILSNLYLASMLRDSDNFEKINQLTFYGISDLVSSGDKVLVDSNTFPTEAEALRRISTNSTNRSGKADWLKMCESRSCDAELIFQTDKSVVAYFKYAKTPSQRTVLECHSKIGVSSRRCAVLYQVMLQSLVNTSDVFNEVQFFTLFIKQKPEEAKMLEGPVGHIYESLPKSVCATWIRKGIYTFKEMLGQLINLTIGVSTFGVVFYLLLSTVTCIRVLKFSGFLQHLVRNGLSVSVYWSTVLIITCVECAIFSVIFVASFQLQCPGVYSLISLEIVFIYVFFYFFGIAVLCLLTELLVPHLIVVAIVTLTLSSTMQILLCHYSIIKKHAVFVVYILPLMNAAEFISTQLLSNIVLKTLELNLIGKFHPFYQNLVIATVIWVLLIVVLTIYLDFLLPNGNGLYLPLDYPFSLKFWNPNLIYSYYDELLDFNNQMGHHFEQVKELRPSIIINQIYKNYPTGYCCCDGSCCDGKIGACCKDGPTVLYGLSCSMYADQITAIIGHNGCGKSTLLKILTGEESANSGDAYINGYETTNSIERLALRGSITICPQLDSLSGALSVIENIRITLVSKGLLINNELENARVMMRWLDLADKEDVKVYELSGAQKRKLNTILALLGDPEIVFLDEPTSGLDPISRRKLWQLLHEKKVGRSIVLFTHFMDEADILADRKMFLCGGEIVCAGSSVFLKQAFGCNFTLQVSLKSPDETPKLISKLKQVQVKSQLESELQLDVPATQHGVLIEAVNVLETSPGVQDFRLSQANLDDIFMKLSGVSSTTLIEAFRTNQVASLIHKSSGTASQDANLSAALSQTQPITVSKVQQFSALLHVNVKRQIRSKSGICTRIIMPLVLLAFLALIMLIELLTLKKNSPANQKAVAAGARYKESRVRIMTEIREPLYSNIACIHDENMPIDVIEGLCHDLVLERESGEYVMSKPRTQSMKAFMASKKTIEKLKKNCIISDAGTCVIYYISSWNISDTNSIRKINIGVFSNGINGTSEVALTFQTAFNLVSLLFNAGDFRNKTALSHLNPVENVAALEVGLLWFLILFCWFPVSCMRDPLEDARTGVRSQLMSMGMSNLAYWINTFLLHWIQYTACFTLGAALLMILPKCRQVYFVLPCIYVLILGTAINQILIYIIAIMSKTKNKVVLLVTQLVFVFLPITAVILGNLKDQVPILVALILGPPLAPVTLIYSVVMYASYCLDYFNLDYASEIPQLYTNMIYFRKTIVSLLVMPAHLILLLSVMTILEKPDVIWLLFSKRLSDTSENSAMDQGAKTEAEMIKNNPHNPTNVLEITELFKTYQNGVRAVQDVSFGTISNEVFGLFGANGAGKTTSISVIIGEEKPTSGQCEVRGHGGVWLSGRSLPSSGAIGYCPQHNPLYKTITVAEHLNLYAAIRGLTQSAAKGQIDALMSGLGLQSVKDSQSSQLSFGKKRRLCLAIALLGNPMLVVIDEASNGIDPENKRFIWRAIRAMLNGQRSVIVTTNSMEEVEAICHRVGIMNRGRMIALGTVQQLQSLYGDAYTLDFLLPVELCPLKTQHKIKIEQAILQQFSGAVLIELMSQCVQFYVPKSSVPQLSEALSWLAQNQNHLDVSYFALYQMSLDQMFIKLVKKFDG